MFFTRQTEQTPPALCWHVLKNRSLHERALSLKLTRLSKPRTDAEGRIAVMRGGENYWRAEAFDGFMQQPDVPAILGECNAKGAAIDLDDVIFYVGHETILPRWRQASFAFMGRNAARISDYLKLPWDQVVEIGREIEL